MSRAEASRARLAAQRERIAQQRARLSASGARASGMQRSESGASVHSNLSSILEQPAQQERGSHVPGLPVSHGPAAVSIPPHDRSSEAPRRQAIEPLPHPALAVPSERLSGSSEDDRRPPGLQGRSSGASDGSRGSGLSPGGPRSRSAAIDVPTSPNRVRRSPRYDTSPASPSLASSHLTYQLRVSSVLVYLHKYSMLSMLAWQCNVLHRTAPSISERWRRYPPYEDDPYLPKMGAPPVADPVPAHVYTIPTVLGQGKAAREQVELSPVREVINTGFASIDSKQKASQLFSIPARLSKGAAEGAQTADKPAAEAPRRKKKEEGSLPPMLKPPAGKQPGPEQPAVASSNAPTTLSGKGDLRSSTESQALPLGGALASGKIPAAASQQMTDSSSQQPGSQSALSIPSAPPGDAAADLVSVDVPAPSLPAQTTPEAPPVKPYFPAFGSLIPPVPEDSFWQSAPAAGSEEIHTTSKIQEAGNVQCTQLHAPATYMPPSAPAGDPADTDFWASAGQHAETAMQQPDLSSMHHEGHATHSKEAESDQHQHWPPPAPDLPRSSAPDSESRHFNDSTSMTDASFQGSSAFTHDQAGSRPGPSTDPVPSSVQHVEPEPANSSTLVMHPVEDGIAPPQGAEEQQAPIVAQVADPFGLADGGYISPLDQCASPFPSGQDEDTSFFEGLGAPGNDATPVWDALAMQWRMVAACRAP